MGWDQFFPLTGDATADQQQLESLAGQLRYISDNVPGAMVMLQTSGEPKARTTAWGQVGNALTPFGGTESACNQLDGTGDYALVARSGAGATSSLQDTASAESSAPLEAANMNTTAKATAGTLRGVIGRGPRRARDHQRQHERRARRQQGRDRRRRAGQPLRDDGARRRRAAALAADGCRHDGRPAVHRQAAGDPGTEGAGYCYQPTTWDLRAEYCNATQKDSWASTYAGQLDALTYPSDQSFTEDQFNAVVKQLGGDKNAPGEFGMIAPVFDMTAQLQEPIANSQAQTALDIADATSQVESDLTPRWTPSSPTRRRSPTTR